MRGKDYIEKMRESPLYQLMEEYENPFRKPDGTFDWGKFMKAPPIIITREEVEEYVRQKDC